MAKLFQFFIFCILQSYSLCLHAPIKQANHLCPYDQSLSLLKFKDSLQMDTYKEHCSIQVGYFDSVSLPSYCGYYNIPIESKISSWNSSTDCCSWEGVTCDEFTGKVIELDLSANMVKGVIDSNSTIFRLSHLKKLNLAYNRLYGSEISPIISRLTHLSHLNLTKSGMRGKVPSEISQLNELVSLDLSGNDGFLFEPHVFKLLFQNMTRLRVLSLEGVDISSSVPRNLSSSLTVIDLDSTNLKGTFPNQLFHLPSLQQLSLSSNSFDDFISFATVEWNTSSSLQKLELQDTFFQQKLLNTIGNLKQLTYLDISYCDLNGTLPQYYENLTQLSHLDLSYNYFSGQIPSGILSLEHLTFLDIGSNELDTAILPFAFNNLKRLKVLSLQGNKLTTTTVSSFLRNLTQLEAIDLADNSLYEIPLELFELPLLQMIDLSHNQLHGAIPKSFSNLVNLRNLNLGSNNFSGCIETEALSNLVYLRYLNLVYLRYLNLGCIETEALSNLVYLRYLNLGFNHFSGSIEKVIISNLVNLKYFNLESNNFSGPLVIDKLSNLVNLTTLVLSSNNFNGSVDVKFLSSFKWMYLLDLSFNNLTLINGDDTNLPIAVIASLGLGSCNIKSLDVLRSIVVLDHLSLPNNNIHGEIPEWAWSSWSSVKVLDISNNSITHIGSKIPLQSLEFFNLKSNLLQGTLPILPLSISILSISNNQFHGEIKSICKLSELEFLDLSNNSFSGDLPHCIGTMNSRLVVLDLHMNKLEGTIPELNSMNNLMSLNLGANHLEGDLPRSLTNCSSLEVLDLSENNLNDSFPAWLGALPYLRVLSLRSNSFYGAIYSHHDSSNDFSQLQILDLSYNQLSGSLPARLLQKFRGMMSVGEIGQNYFGEGSDNGYGNSYHYDHDDSVTVILNGNTMRLERILLGVAIIDLSCNHFEGEIPNSIGGLIAIQRLNLSHNKFTGQIPLQLGNLSNLQSLDFSSNELDGNIPDQIAALGFLSVLNLSYNHLTGRIPFGQQLRTFPNDSYIGNDGLCGYPLSRNCGNDYPRVGLPGEEDDQEFFDGFTWQSVLVGYGVGICVGLVIGSLMLFTEKPKWLIQIVKEEANKMIYKYKSRNGISQTWFRRS